MAGSRRNDPLPSDSVNKKSLAAQIYEVLEERIVSGKLAPGTRLAEGIIAKQLSVSRSPVREAIAELQRVGLAERSSFHDRRVLVPTQKFVSDLFDSWIVLQCGQVYLSSLQATKEDLAEIADILDSMKAALSNKKRYRELSRRFSEMLKKGCDNGVLNGIIDGQRKHLHWLSSVYYAGEAETPEESHNDHLLIYKNFRAQDLTGLVTSIKQHADKQREKILSKLTGGQKSGRARNGGLD